MHKIRAKQRQHVVEWIPGVGVVTDGVVDATSLNGPWTWTPPDGVVTAVLDGTGPGGGGGGGYGSTNNRGGGGGGASGISVTGLTVGFLPDQTVTVTAGAVGTGGAVGGNGANAGHTTVEGLIVNGSLVPGKLIFLGGRYGVGSTGTAGGAGGYGAVSGSAGAGGAAGTAGGGGTSFSVALGPAVVVHSNASGGGGANATGSVAGANGGVTSSYAPAMATVLCGNSALSSAGVPIGIGAGTTDATTSYGGGGMGGMSLLGLPTKGGNGNEAGDSTGIGYGAGGPGGGGNAAGGAGGKSYVRITYWSVP